MSFIRRKIASFCIRFYSPESFKYAQKGYRLFHGKQKTLKDYQTDAMESLVLYAYKHTIYYKKVFDNIGLINNGKVNWDNWHLVPVLTKDIIRKERNNMISDEFNQRGAYKNTSGGSTGEPVEFIQDKEYFTKNFGDKILFGLLNGKYPGDKELKIWGSERDIIEGSVGLKEKLINFIFNRRLINSFVLDNRKIQHAVKMINQWKPVQIWAYADSIYEIASYVKENNICMFSPKIIMTTAGVLYDEMRAAVQEAFPKSNVINQYGSREAGAIGVETNGSVGIRVFSHSVLVEIKDSQTGEISDYGEGDFLVTNLTNYSMPLIRFEIGDMGVISDREGYKGAFPVIEKLRGRVNSHILKRDGSKIHGEYFTHLFYNKSWVKNFQVIQNDYDSIIFQIVCREYDSKQQEKDLEEMVRLTRLVLGDSCHVDIKFVDNIPKLKSGKYQFVISKMRG